MTRKDYRLIADAIAATGSDISAQNSYEAGYQTARLDIIQRLQHALRSTNPSFDPERFKEACKP